jgi:hypothetical protein
VVFRTTDAVGYLRGALARMLPRTDYRVVHVSAAKRLNRELPRKRGEVFAFRYHATPITSPMQARNAITQRPGRLTEPDC